MRIVVISGPVGAGKTTVAEVISGTLDATLLRSVDVIKRRSTAEARTRAQLQEFGDELDVRTNGKWLAREIADLRENDAPIVVDAVRIPAQVEAIRQLPLAQVLHVHLTAPTGVLRERYLARAATRQGELASYDEVRRNQTERNVERLSEISDLCFDTAVHTCEDIVSETTLAVGRLG